MAACGVWTSEATEGRSVRCSVPLVIRGPHPYSSRMRLALVFLLLLTACPDGDDGGFSGQQPPDPPVDPNTLCIDPGLSRCDGFTFQVCTQGRWVDQETCDGDTPQCDPIAGCRGCQPDTRFCSAQEVWACDAEGTLSLEEECSDSEECILGDCWDQCSQAEGTNSYLGCNFLAVPLANILAPAFNDDFAVVVGNPSSRADAEVTIRRDGALVTSGVVDPGESRAFTLPNVPALNDFSMTSLVPGGAYEVSTSVPVAAYQYNPLHFEADGDPSFTNDASLLLPEHVLTGNYRINGWPTLGYLDPAGASWVPGIVAVTAVQDGTLVELSAEGYTRDGVFSPLEPGQSTVISLDRGEVLQVLSMDGPTEINSSTCDSLGGEVGFNGTYDNCLLRGDGDLTGSVISSESPLAVFSGHVCSFVPFNAWACDHLEEMMFPVETWGRRVAMSAPMRPEGGAVAPTVYRLLADADDTQLTFSGGVHDPRTLDAGEVLEFTSAQDFVVDANRNFHVAQFLVGQDALNSNAGDPAMGSGIPLNQWRTEYDFLVPDTYSSNYVNLVAPAGTEVYLDGQQLIGWQSVDATEFSVLRTEVQAGAHRLESVADVGFGVTSYGYARFTSYLYPGGMNFLR